MILFPYPEPVDFAPISPKSSAYFPLPGPPLPEQQWTLELRVSDATRAPGEKVPDVPDLAAVLSQPPAAVWPTTSASAEEALGHTHPMTLVQRARSL